MDGELSIDGKPDQSERTKGVKRQVGGSRAGLKDSARSKNTLVEGTDGSEKKDDIPSKDEVLPVQACCRSRTSLTDGTDESGKKDDTSSESTVELRSQIVFPDLNSDSANDESLNAVLARPEEDKSQIKNGNPKPKHKGKQPYEYERKNLCENDENQFYAVRCEVDLGEVLKTLGGMLDSQADDLDATTTRGKKNAYLSEVKQALNELSQTRDAEIAKRKMEVSTSLKQCALDKGFKVVDNQGKGNCMFHALSDQLERVMGISVSHEQLRITAVGYLDSHEAAALLGQPWELFPFVSFRYSSWQEYLIAMSQDGIDGDHMILVAVANYYKTCICVLNTQSQKTIIRPKCVVDNSKMLVLGHVPELHYVSLRPEQVESSKSSLVEGKSKSEDAISPGISTKDGTSSREGKPDQSEIANGVEAQLGRSRADCITTDPYKGPGAILERPKQGSSLKPETSSDTELSKETVCSDLNSGADSRKSRLDEGESKNEDAISPGISTKDGTSSRDGEPHQSESANGVEAQLGVSRADCITTDPYKGPGAIPKRPKQGSSLKPETSSENMQDLRGPSVQTPIPGDDFPRPSREVRQHERDLERQLIEMRQREDDFQRQLRETKRQLRQKDQEVNELELSLLKAQQNISQFRRQGTCDWVISRDEIQMTENCLGRGGWGHVSEGIYCGYTVAVKQIYDLILSPHNRLLFEREMNIASACRHPCLLQFIGATNDEGSPLFVTELMEKSLRALLEEQPLSETDIRVISLDVACALNYLHKKRPSPIIHRDVSSANVLLWRQGNQWRGKVSDYGTANFMQQTMTVAPGTMIYGAPEALSSNQTPKVDVYSFGVLLCEMCIRELPNPEGREEQVVLMSNRALRDLVRRCLQTDPEARPTMQEIIDELSRAL